MNHASDLAGLPEVEIRSKRPWASPGYPDPCCDVCGHVVREGYVAVIHYCDEPEADFGSRATVYLHRDCARRLRYVRFADRIGP